MVFSEGLMLANYLRKRPTSTTSTLKQDPTKKNVGNQNIPVNKNLVGLFSAGLPTFPSLQQPKPIKVPNMQQQIQTPQPTQQPTLQTQQPQSYETQPYTPTQYQGFPSDYSNIPAGLQQARQTGEGLLNQQEAIGSRQIFDTYQSTMGDIKFQEMQTAGNFLNAPVISGNIDKVKGAISQRITDPNAIAQNTGLPIETVNKIISGRAFEDLQLSGTPGVELQRFNEDYKNKISDLSLQQQRGTEDIAIKQQRLQEQLTKDTADVQRNVDMNIIAGEKMGALTGQGMSSGYQQGLQNIQNEAQRTIKDLTKQWDNQTSDITRLKNRMLEDYTLNTQRLKQQFDRGLDDTKIQAISLMQDYQNKYGIASSKFSEALSTLQQAVLKEKLQLTDNYMKGMKDYQSTQYDYYKLLLDTHKTMNDVKIQDGQVIYTDEFGQTNILPVADYQSRTIMSGGQSANQYNLDGLLFKKGQNSGSIGSNNQGTITFLGDTSKIGGWMGGVDIAGKYGQDIHPENDGVVHNFGTDNSTGNKRVEIARPDGIVVRYNHLSDNGGLTKGQQVNKTSVIGKMGATGKATGVHVDITAYQGGGSRDGGQIISTLDGQLRAIYGDRVDIMKQAQGQQGQQNLNNYLPIFRGYVEDGKIPTKATLTNMGMTMDEFSNNAQEGYKQYLNSNYGTKGFTITNPDAISYISDTERRDLNKSIDEVAEFNNNINRLKKLVTESGTKFWDQIWGGTTGVEMRQYANALRLTAKNLEDLGVLNGGDWAILSDLIPDPTDINSARRGKETVLKALNTVETKYVEGIRERARNYGLEFIGPKGTTQQTTGGTDLNSLLDKYFQ